MYRLLYALVLTGCVSHIEHKHFRVEVEEGWWRSYVYTEIIGDNGQAIPGSGKLTICNGMAGFAGNLMQDAAIVGGSALIGQGLGASGTTVSSSSRSSSSQTQSQGQSQATQATNNAGAGKSVQRHEISRHGGRYRD